MSSSVRRVEDLEDPSLLSHQQWEWRAERVGWLLMALTVVAALAGLLGPGPLSSQYLASPDETVRVEYNAVERYDAPTQMMVRFRGDDAADRADLVVSRTLADAITLEQIVPEPELVTIRGNDVVYSFRRAPGESELHICLRCKYDEFGIFHHQVGLDGREPLVIRQYVLP